MTRRNSVILLGGVVVLVSAAIALYVVTVANNNEPPTGASSASTSPITKAFNYSTMPQSFIAGRFRVTMVDNGTGYDQRQGPINQHFEYNGFATVFNVTDSSGETQTVPFFWNIPFAPTSSSALPFNSPSATRNQPTPPSASAFSGNVIVSWSKQSSNFVVTFLFK